MAASFQRSVAQTAVELARASGAGSQSTVLIRNTSGNSIFVGGPGVTAGTGYEIPTVTKETVLLAAGEALYAVSSTGTNRVDVLVSD